MSAQSYLRGDNAVNISRSVEEAVSTGHIEAGAHLPPVRTLATHLGVSPATVAAAYRLLQERGVVVADGRRGTRVRPASPVAPPAAESLPPGVRDLARGNPDPALLPDLAAAARKAALRPRLYGEELNDAELLRLARRQFEADDVPAPQVAIVSGALDGIERTLREHLRAGDRVAVEDPSFTGILDLLNALSLQPVPARVDDEGLIPSELRTVLKGNVKALIVTPRAQNPMGGALTEGRARQLRHLLASRDDLLLIEDDHAGPIAGAKYLTLADGSRDRWVVVRSVSKSLGPDLRLAVMTGDVRTLARVEGRQMLGIRWVSHLLQGIVATLWSDRRVHRQLEVAARAYTDRRTALLDALADRGIAAHGRSGLNVWIPVAEETAVVQALFRRGWAVTAGERYRMETAAAVRVTVATLAPEEADAFAEDFADVLRPTGRRTIA